MPEGSTLTQRTGDSDRRADHPLRDALEHAHLPAGELTREMRREGFEAGNADKIFESTYSEQTEKRSGRAATDAPSG